MVQDKKKFYRRRFVDDNFDIDLTYITENIIVMGNPYNNDSLNQIRTFLKTKHSGHYRIFNLASEEDFNIEADLDNVENFPISPNNPCPLQVIIKFCSVIDVYLKLKRENVVVIHCRTGKGRSCMLTACYLLHAGVFTDADEAMQFVIKQRTPIRLNALTVPSQIRYLYYYETLLKSPQVTVSTLRINHVRMTTIPAYNSSIVNSGCSPFIVISVLDRPETNRQEYARQASQGGDSAWYPKVVYNQLAYENKRKLRRYVTHHDEHADFDLTRHDVRVRGDVCLSLFAGGDEKMAQLYMHTAFVSDSNYLVFTKAAVDIANKDKQCYSFAADFKIEVFLQRVQDDPDVNVLGNSNDDISDTAINHMLDAQQEDTEGGLQRRGGSERVQLAIEESDEDNDDPYAIL